MKLRDVFILEGLNDRKNRELAERASRTLIDNIGMVKKPHYVGLDDDDYVCAAYRGWQLPDVPDEVKHLFEETMFFICAPPPGAQSGYASFSHSSKFKMDTLNVYIKTAGKQISEEAWAKYVETKNERLLEPRMNQIVHEFIHAIDSKRLSDPTYMDTLRYDPEKLGKGDKGERKKYANEPLEFNGIFQQFTQWIESNIRNAGGLEGLQINSPRNMVTYGMQAFPHDWVANLSPELRRHFIKRLNQFYTDMKSKYS